MLKKTLLATAGLSASLLAVAALLPSLDKFSSGASHSTSSSTAESLARAPAQAQRQTADGERSAKTERHLERDGDHHESTD